MKGIPEISNLQLGLSVGLVLLAGVVSAALRLGLLRSLLWGTVRTFLQLTLIGYALSPIAWLIGVPWGDSVTIGSLIGQKVIINEFVAYLELSQIPAGQLSEKATLIATYALCGFANFSSIAIQIGGIGGIAPDRRSDLAKFGLRAVLGGTLATMMTATIAGVLSGIVL